MCVGVARRHPDRHPVIDPRIDATGLLLGLDKHLGLDIESDEREDFVLALLGTIDTIDPWA